MEAAGVADAVSHAESFFFVVRGTCDYCNEDKNDDWQFYAAAAAAAYARALVEEVPRTVPVPQDPNPPVRSLQDRTTPPALPRTDTSPHVFVSYVREDDKRVGQICDALESAGIKIWRDRTQLTPGQRWRTSIRRAIESGNFFLACFSSAYYERNSTYMNEELNQAIEVMRQINTDRVWFIPVLLDDCSVPDWEIRSGERLPHLQHVRFHEDPDGAIRAIIQTITGAEATTVSLAASATASPGAHVDDRRKAVGTDEESVSAELRSLKTTVEELASRLIPGTASQNIGPADAQRLLEAVQRHLNVLEHDEAVEFLPLLKTWLQLHERQLDKGTIVNMCLMIARLDILRHKKAKSRGDQSDLRLAQQLTEKARAINE